MLPLRFRTIDTGYIEFFILAADMRRRQVASLIPLDNAIQGRHQWLAKFLCQYPRAFLSRHLLNAFAAEFGLHPVFVIREAEGWDVNIWCPIETVLAEPEFPTPAAPEPQASEPD